MIITLLTGDVTKVKADAIVTTVNSSGLWFGALDEAIRRTAGLSVHSELAKKLHVCNAGMSVKCPAYADTTYSNVVFVIDDLNKDLWVPLYTALDISEFHRYETVAIPTVRRGVMKGIKEKTTDEYVKQFIKGIYEFIKDNPESAIKHIVIVVYDDSEVYDLLHKLLSNLGEI